MVQNHEILVINPGSTSTKVAIFDDEELIASKTLRHSAEELSHFNKLTDQFEFRAKIIEEFIRENGMQPSDFQQLLEEVAYSTQFLVVLTRLLRIC